MLFHRVTKKSYDDNRFKFSQCIQMKNDLCRVLKCYNCIDLYKINSQTLYDYIVVTKNIEYLLEKTVIFDYIPGDFVLNTKIYFEKVNTLNTLYLEICNLVNNLNMSYLVNFLEKYNIDLKFIIDRSSGSSIRRSFEGKFNFPDYPIVNDEDLIKHIDKNYYETIKDTILSRTYK